MLYRRSRLAVLATASILLATVPATRLRAQSAGLDPRCANSGASVTLPAGVPTDPTGRTQVSLVTQDACQKAVDLFNFLAPQLGAVVAGSGAELGGGGALGGLGHLGLGVRVNVLGSGRLPDLSGVQLSYTGAQRTDFAVRRQVLPFPEADLGVGLFGGVPVGLTRVGGLDLLLNAAYIPNVTRDQIRVRRTGGALQLGYGVRLGLLQQSRFVPGVGVSFLRRELPTTSIAGTTSSGDSVGVRDARVRADSWRITASYGVSFLGLSAGVGQDRYDTRATVSGVVLSPTPSVVAGPFTFAQDFTQRLTRDNAYVGVNVPLAPYVRLAGEVGRASGGGTVATYNTFSGRTPTDAYGYGSLGLRLGW